MKATELMVGDLVCLKDDTKYELPLKVDGIIEDDISLEGDGFLGGVDGLIRPIPITTKILEKNGWKRDCRGFMEKEVNGNAYLSWDGYCATLYQDNYYMCDCKYVHTIQHVLRLCGLDELADNFKV